LNNPPYPHDWTLTLPNFSNMGQPFSTIMACKLDMPDHDFTEGFPGVDSTLVEWFAIRFTATLGVPSTGTYNFKSAPMTARSFTSMETS